MNCYKCLNPVEGEGVHGLHEQCFSEWFQVKPSEREFSLTMKTAGNSNDPAAHLNSSFFHGKFKKYSARLGGSGYIIKVRQEPFVELPAAEYLCNQIAKALLLDVPDFFLIKLEGQTDAFVCKNFMEQYPDSNLLHLYRLMGEKPFDLENIMQVILAETGDERDVERFARVCLFDALIGNHDRHGRNLAFIQTPKGKALSPCYDNPSCLAIEEEWLLKSFLEPCGKIHTSTSSEPTIKDYAIEFRRLDKEFVLQEFADAVNLQKIANLISNAFISNTRKEAFLKLIERRYHELQRVLKNV